MDKVSYVGIFISILIAIFSFSQLGKMISAISAKKNKRILIHLLGFVANALVAVLVFSESFNFNIESNILIYGSIAIALIYYVIAVFDSLCEVKEVKSLKGMRQRRM
ncbi:MAG: hypothetical protein PUE01_09895 [Clostridiaceae bacterium]|nr:hypothetical protein [Clostridiaceae bacterium]